MFYHQLTSGEIAPFSIVQLEVIFNPLKSGNVVAEFEISFSDPLSPPVSRKHEDKLRNSLQKPCFIRAGYMYVTKILLFEVNSVLKSLLTN